MKARTVIMISLILLSSIYTTGASSQIFINSSEGKISGRVETQGRCMPVAVSDLKVACGKSLKNYEIKITNDFGYFEFENIQFEDSGTKYYIWILPGQRVILPGVKTIILDENTREGYVYFFVFVWNFKDLINYQMVMQILESSFPRLILKCQ
jgi:hypothetical protein